MACPPAENKSANTAAARYRSLRQFFRWLADEADELDASPMASMRPTGGETVGVCGYGGV